MYMLDTNAIIMAIRHPEHRIVEKIRQHLGRDLCISVVTLGELEYGAKKSRDPEKTRNGIYLFLSGIPVLDFDANAARHFGDILGDLDMRHERISDRDTMIAGHARSLDCTVVTNNMREFSRVNGLQCEDWTE